MACSLALARTPRAASTRTRTRTRGPSPSKFSRKLCAPPLAHTRGCSAPRRPPGLLLSAPGRHEDAPGLGECDGRCSQPSSPLSRPPPGSVLSAYGTLTVRSLLDTREHCLNEFNFPDPYSKVSAPFSWVGTCLQGAVGNGASVPSCPASGCAGSPDPRLWRQAASWSRPGEGPSPRSSGPRPLGRLHRLWTDAGTALTSSAARPGGSSQQPVGVAGMWHRGPLASSWPPELSLETQELVPEDVRPGHEPPRAWLVAWRCLPGLFDQEAACPGAVSGVQSQPTSAPCHLLPALAQERLGTAGLGAEDVTVRAAGTRGVWVLRARPRHSHT